MSKTSNPTVATMGIDIGKNSFHVVGLDQRGAIMLRQKWSRGQIEARLANMPPCLIGMEACVGAHHLSRKLQSQGHDARLMPAKYVRAYSKGQKNDFRDAEAVAEAVQRPTMKFVATKTTEQLDLHFREWNQRGALRETQFQSHRRYRACRRHRPRASRDGSKSIISRQDGPRVHRLRQR
jgi:transposase